MTSDAALELGDSFNPHSRKGSDGGTIRQHRGYMDVSIHTPARGVTCPAGSRRITDTVSIHTPARGVTSRPAWIG